MNQRAADDYTWVAQAEALGRDLVQFARRRVGRLVAATVAVDASIPAEAVVGVLQQELRRAGHGPVYVSVTQRGGPMQVLSVEVES